ncbi:MAG: RNA polymerase sigma-54 factor, partial [Myxococcales bacterium]|nr:RNA polymerase sigma-54 factor [Myxococcales bacterium]
MAIELKQQLKLTQQLVMTPQLQQAIKLLQLSQLELVDVVQQELQENPVLEETPEIEDDLPAEVRAENESPDTAAAEVSSDASSPEPSDVDKIADIDWQNYMDAYPQTGMGVNRDDDERRSLEATLTQRPTLADHLEWQLHLSEFETDEGRSAEWIIGNIDERGFLRASVEELSRQSGISEEVISATLAKIQRFDPPGVAARNLRECLLNQLGPLGIRDPLVQTILEDHLELLQKRDFRRLAKALDVPIEEIAAAAGVIARLDPRPGRAYGGDDPIYIVPDIYVHKLADEFHIVLN